MEAVDNVTADAENSGQQTAIATPAQTAYLDPEGGYADVEVGRAAEIAAMTR